MSRIAKADKEALREQQYSNIRDMWNAMKKDGAVKETYNDALIRWAKETEGDNDDENNSAGS